MASLLAHRSSSPLFAQIGLPVVLAASGMSFWVAGAARPAMAVLVGLALLLTQRAGQHASPLVASWIALRRGMLTGHTTGVLMVEIDNFEDPGAPQTVRPQVHLSVYRRLHAALLHDEHVFSQHPGRFAIVLSATRDLGLEQAVQLCRQLQNAAEAPVITMQGRSFPTVSVGLCLSSRIAHPTGGKLLSGARAALDEARQRAPAAIRSYSDLMQSRIDARSRMTLQLSQAFDSNEIRPYFQPQICTQTGALTGFEALARWEHPQRGLIPPAEFMPALEGAGLLSRLGAHMVTQSLNTLAHWDRRGIKIPRIGVNFSTDELRDPSLVEKVAFELDRHGLEAHRLAVEVLETVVADCSGDVICTNLAGLAKLGCCIDLDDFGTGHASITNVRRFSIQRIKIDRSFVSGIDHNTEQQNMVSAILTMAERLGLETLAEGVETEAERHSLDALGCGHLQGFAIARPMSSEDCEEWLTQRAARMDSRVAELPRRAV